MASLRTPLAAVLLATGVALAAPSPADALAPTLVRSAMDVSLVTGTTEVQAGAPFEVAVCFTVPAGWYLFWENPGSTGMAPRIHLHTPPGWHVGDVAFPGPSRFTAPSGTTSYGYDGTTAFFVEVVPPAHLDPGEEAILTLRSAWVICNGDVCVPGESTSGLRVVGTRAPPPPPLQDPVLAAIREQLPLPLAGGVWSFGGTDERPERTLVAPLVADDFFPGAELARCVEAHALTAGKGTTRLHLVLSEDRSCGYIAPLTGLLRISSEEGPRFIEVDVPPVEGRGRLRTR